MHKFTKKKDMFKEKDQKKGKPLYEERLALLFSLQVKADYISSFYTLIT